MTDRERPKNTLRQTDLPLLIQGGMGVGVSNWELAKAVSIEGQLGVVSGTGINTVFIRRLQDGDVQGHLRRALSHFPDQDAVRGILNTYWRHNGRLPGQGYKRSALPTLDASVGLQRLNAIASFVEVFLAKEDHDGIVEINFLEKLQTSNLPGIYGAMLAGVDYVLMGAGVPREIPGVLDSFSRNEKALIKVSLTEDHQEQASDLHIDFDPKTVFSNLNASSSLRRPRFLPIISSATLALHLSRKSNGKVDGFVVENHLAGGHNAPPRGVLQLNERSEPIYGERDDADLETIRKIGLPFWLAGSFGSPQSLKQALHWGATGIQVGTPFAFCNESGLSQKLKQAVIRRWCLENDLPEKATVFTDPLASPTGFPFKVVPIEKSLSDESLFQARPRKCDLGYLRQIVRTADGKVVYRCPAEPINDFLKKGGKREETINRKCLCNALMANINNGQTQENGYEELPLVTAGNDLTQLRQFLSEGREYYGAKDVISHLLHATEGAEQI